MNISPTTYKGTKLAMTVPKYSVMLVSNSTSLVTDTDAARPAALDEIDLSHLKVKERAELTQLLTRYLPRLLFLQGKLL